MPKPPELAKVVAATMVTAALVAGGYVVSEQDDTRNGDAAQVRYATVEDPPEVAASDPGPDTPAEPASAKAKGAQLEAARGAQAAVHQSRAQKRLEARVNKRARLLARLVEKKVVLPATFDLATFNILGAMHTAPGSDASHMAHWRIRADWTGQYIQSKGLDIVGLQEVEPMQYDAIMSATGGQFDGWPAKYMRGVDNRAIMTTLIWRTSEWQAVERSYITIPFMEWRQESPVVKLRSVQTGREIWVINTHNAPRSLAGQRTTATNIEVDKINELVESGLPVFFMGDMNERNPIYDRITSRTPLTTPNGGQTGRIDYIFGPTDVSYSGFAVERPGLVTQITDHNVVKVTVKLPRFLTLPTDHEVARADEG